MYFLKNSNSPSNIRFENKYSMQSDQIYRFKVYILFLLNFHIIN